MKKRVICVLLAAVVAAGSLAGCGGKSSDGGASSGEEGKVINIYSCNDEFRERVEAVYPEVKETSSDRKISTFSSAAASACFISASSSFCW